MIEFRQKDFSIQEGHYTGPKDQDKVPGAVEVIGKSALGGALAGSAIGAALKDTTIWEGATQGGKYGALSGIVLKFFLNYLHNPMTRVKYQEVDKLIRREFGIFRLSGVTVGDSVSKRARVDEKFGFNDRNVTDYKISFCVQDDQVTMYTLGISNDELKKIDKILDYYCKKYTGMEYSATRLNERCNSYAVYITFTNYQVISNFIMELSNELETRINLLDNKALIQGRFQDSFNKDNGEEEDSRNFSVTDISKSEAIKILGDGGYSFLRNVRGTGPGKAVAQAILGLVTSYAAKMSKDELANSKIPVPKEFFGNDYLINTLDRLRYVEGFHYTYGEKKSENNFSLCNGLFIITSLKNSEDCKTIDKKFWQSFKNKIRRSDTGKVIMWTYSIESRKDFDFILKKLMSTGIIFNLFEGC